MFAIRSSLEKVPTIVMPCVNSIAKEIAKQRRTPFINECFLKIKGKYKPNGINANILSKQELDIYIPQYKIAIEFQGEQHFCPSNGFYNEDVVRHDNMKKEYCEKNNIKLIEIMYKRNYDLTFKDLRLEELE